MDRNQLLELVPHYVAMLILVVVVLAAVGSVVGELDFWGELVIVLVVVFAYPPIVRRLGYAPSMWTNR